MNSFFGLFSFSPFSHMLSKSSAKVAGALICGLFNALALAQSPAVYAINPDQSEVTWSGAKEVGDTHTGTIKISSGNVTVVGNEITDVQIVIDMKSIVNTDVKDATYNKKLVDHLSNEDFFKTDEFKTSEFKMNTGKKVKIDGGKAAIPGKLTIRGKTKEFTIDLSGVTVAADKAQASGKIKFDRTQFDVKYNSSSFPNLFKVAKDKIIKNDVELDFKVAALPKK